MKAFELGSKFREERERLGLSTEEVGFLSDVSRNHIGQIERGEKIPRVDTAEKISKALNKELAEILLSIPTKTTDNDKHDLYLRKLKPYLNELNDIQFDYINKFIKNYVLHCKEIEKQTKK